MANPASEANGTQTATVTTEHVLRDTTVAGTFQLVVSLENMVAGDVLELRVYRKLLASGAKKCVATGYFYGVPMADFQVAEGPFVGNFQTTDADALEFTLKQTFGTSRNFPWQVFKYT